MTGGVGSVGTYYADPYFLQAYQTTNPNEVAFKGNQSAAAAAGSAQSAASNDSVFTSYAPVSSSKEEKKGMSTGGKILTGAALIGAAAYIYGAVKGKSWNPKNVWNTLKSVFNGTKDKLFSKDVASITCDGNLTTCNIPGRTNVIKNAENVAQEAAKVGIKMDAIPQYTADAIKNKELAYSWFEIAAGEGNADKYRVVGDKILKYTNGKWSLQETGKVAEDVLNKIEQVKNGVTVENVTKAFFKNGSTTAGDGVVRHFKFENGVTDLFTLKTKAFATDSKAVQAYCLDHPEFKKALEAIGKGKVPENFKTLNGVYQFKDGAKVKITNGKITEFSIKGADNNYTNIGIKTDDFKLYKEAHKDEFEKLANAKNMNGFLSTTWTF